MDVLLPYCVIDKITKTLMQTYSLHTLVSVMRIGRSLLRQCGRMVLGRRPKQRRTHSSPTVNLAYLAISRALSLPEISFIYFHPKPELALWLYWYGWSVRSVGIANFGKAVYSQLWEGDMKSAALIWKWIDYIALRYFSVYLFHTALYISLCLFAIYWYEFVVLNTALLCMVLCFLFLPFPLLNRIEFKERLPVFPGFQYIRLGTAF